MKLFPTHSQACYIHYVCTHVFDDGATHYVNISELTKLFCISVILSYILSILLMNYITC